MQRVLLILVAVCGVAFAMVPGERQAVDTAERNKTNAVTTPKPIICEQNTPCEWEVYNPTTRKLRVNIANSYCTCGTNTTCTPDPDANNMQTNAFYCRPTTTDTTSEHS